MNILIKHFEELSARELFEIYELRSRVFVVEQNCAYQDVDRRDLTALHVMMRDKDELIGYARILPPDAEHMDTHIGRVVIDKRMRGKNYGRELMKHSIKKALEISATQEIVISAQCYLIKFYSALGFKSEGKEYLEDDIPHIKMRLREG
jgi:ElaA protein